MKKRRRLRGYWILILAALICWTLQGRAGSDIFWVDHDADSFSKRFLLERSLDNTDPQAYVSEQDGAVAVYKLHPSSLSLKADSYDAGIVYDGADSETVLKIYSSDYTSPDNSGGKVLVYEKLDPEQNYIQVRFDLDQDVNSVYVLIETNAPDFSVSHLHMASFGRVWTDTAFYCILTVLCALVLFWLVNGRFAFVAPGTLGEEAVPPERVVRCCVLVGAVSVLVASLPLLQSGLLHGHDLGYHMARIEGLASGLASGQFPVRVHGETLNGFGYPNSYFYPELLWYLPAFLSLLGVHTVTCYKFFLIFIHALTFVLAYLPFKKLFHSRYLALTLSVLYVLNPYRLICAYFRAAVGEFVAITFLPLVLYGLYAILVGEQKDWPYLVAGASGLVQSHILTTELTALLCVVIVLAFLKRLFTKEKRIFSLITAGIYTVLINAWFIFPMLAMSIAIRPAVFTRIQLPFGYARYDLAYLFTTVSLETLGPHMAGWAALLALGFYLAHRAAFPNKDGRRDMVRFADLLAVAAVVSMLATTAYFPWDRIAKIPLLGKLLDVIQFPYRLMSLVGVCTAILAGAAILLWFRKKPHRMLACAGAVCLSIFTACLLCEFAFLGADGYENKHCFVNNLNNSLSVGQYEYLASGATIEDIVDTAPVIRSDNPSFTVSGWERAGTNMRFDYRMELDAEGENTIILPVTYIPKYEVCVNGQRVEISRTDTARIIFTTLAGEGTVTVRYREPAIFRVCELVSVLALAVLPVRKRLAEACRRRLLKNR